MRIITIFNDIHLYGPHSMKVQWEYGPDCFYLGDNIDLSHCLKKDVENASLALVFFKNLFEGRFVRGNHELNVIKAPDFLKVGKTLLTHGDYIFWPKLYALKYRRRKAGVGFLRKWISLSGLDPLRHLFPEARLHRRSLRKLAYLAKKNKCEMIVVGHRHPKKIIYYEYRGIKIIVLPPGKNYVKIVE